MDTCKEFSLISRSLLTAPQNTCMRTGANNDKSHDSRGQAQARQITHPHSCELGQLRIGPAQVELRIISLGPVTSSICHGALPSFRKSIADRPNLAKKGAKRGDERHHHAQLLHTARHARAAWLNSHEDEQAEGKEGFLTHPAARTKGPPFSGLRSPCVASCAQSKIHSPSGWLAKVTWREEVQHHPQGSIYPRMN